MKRLVAEINRKKNQLKSADLIETVKNKSSSQPLSFVERENLRRQQRQKSKSTPVRPEH